MYICLCNCVEDEELKDLIQERPDHTDEELMKLLGVSNGCGVCKDMCKQIIKKTKEEK